MLILDAFPHTVLPPSARDLRREVRAFLADELHAGTFTPRCDSWLSGHSPDFSRKLAARGWVGMTFPRRYGGMERSAVDRFVVVAELLAAGAPVAAHWIGDRQSGPLLLKCGSESLRERLLPAIASGQCYFAIGMSEPDSGSDLSSIRTTAVPVAGGWRLTGSKVWTSNAHRSHYLLTLCRTSPPGANRHDGLSQVIVDVQSPGVQIRPIRLLSGEEHFCEVHFDDVFVPDDMVVGTVGQGWRQVVSELAFERSGPERFLSTYPLFGELVRAIGPAPTAVQAEAIGRLTARLLSLSHLSLAVAARIDAGEVPATEAALVKEVGTRFEREVIETARLIVDREAASPQLTALLADALLHSPGFTLRGGTSEILRGMVARGLTTA